VTALSPTLLALAAVCAVAGIVRGFTGFGAALVMAPAFSLIIGVRQSLALITLLNLITVLQLLVPALRITRWRIVGPMALAASASLPLGTWLLLAAEPEMIRHAVSALVSAFAMMMLSDFRPAWRAGTASAGAVGAASGVLTGLAGVGGPPAVLYLLSAPGGAAQARADFVTYFALTQLSAAIPLTLASMLTGSVVKEALFLTPVYLVATAIGSRMFRFASDDIFRRLATYFLLAVGLIGLLA
jgi:hypothetical protein